MALVLPAGKYDYLTIKLSIYQNTNQNIACMPDLYDFVITHIFRIVYLGNNNVPTKV